MKISYNKTVTKNTKKTRELAKGPGPVSGPFGKAVTINRVVENG